MDDLKALEDAALEKKRLRNVEAQADFEREMGAIRIVRELRLQQVKATNGSPILLTPTRESTSQRETSWPGWRAAIDAATHGKETFVLEDILIWLKAHFPERYDRDGVSRILWKMKERGNFGVETKGSGRTPAVYRNKR